MPVRRRPIAVHDRPAGYGICHCRMCQRWSGAILAAVTCPRDRVSVVGDAAIATYQSSELGRESLLHGLRFAICGTRVTTDGAHEGALRDPDAGLFDEPERLRPRSRNLHRPRPTAFAQLRGAIPA